MVLGEPRAVRSLRVDDSQITATAKVVTPSGVPGLVCDQETDCPVVHEANQTLLGGGEGIESYVVR